MVEVGYSSAVYVTRTEQRGRVQLKLVNGFLASCEEIDVTVYHLPMPLVDWFGEIVGDVPQLFRSHLWKKSFHTNTQQHRFVLVQLLTNHKHLLNNVYLIRMFKRYLPSIHKENLVFQCFTNLGQDILWQHIPINMDHC